MSYYDSIRNEYFDWLVKKVNGKPSDSRATFHNLLCLLHSTAFRNVMDEDENRVSDGIDLRYRFAVYKGRDEDPDTILDILSGPCTVLELMIALAIRCEEIMDDPAIGNRTPQWFWEMVVNLGLGAMYDERFDKQKSIDILNRFMDRKYDKNGKGGLFRIRSSKSDLRKVELWYQMCWYLDSIS